MRIKLTSLALLFLVLCPVERGESINISVSGSWTLVIDESYLQDGPGSDLISDYTSATNQIYVNITGTNTNWRVDIRTGSVHWHPDLFLGVRRTGNGLGFGSISGGTNWIGLTETDQEFFRGSRGRWFITVQCALSGVSVNVPADTYTNTVIYTVTETG